jgi:4-amino-4-deoxy-L-arabinose transferase-like glycosyltransferase
LPIRETPPVDTRPMSRALLWLSLVGIIALNVAGSLYWIQRNVVLVGRDPGGHLERTLRAAEILETPSARTLFELVTLHDYRPPLLYIAAQPFYALFGVSMDSAQYTNVLLFAVVLVLTFLVGRRVTTERMALFATLLAGLLPIMPAMSRLFYMEHLLTAALLLNVLALLACDGFRNRGWTLTWGVSLGVALLVKWTTPVYLLVPTLWLLWRADFFQDQWQAMRRPAPDWIRLIASLALAMIIAALWYLPNRTAAQEMFLGDWMALLWVLALAALFYAWRMEHGVLGNVWTGLLLALVIASLWYFPRIDFLTRLTDVAFGTDRGNQESVNLLRLSNYTRYFTMWTRELMGPLATLLIIAPAAWVWLRRIPGWRNARLGVAVLWLMLLSTYVLLMLLAQATSRNLVPLVPTICILVADSLRGYRRPIALILAVLWSALLLFQWTLYTFDFMAPVQTRSAALWTTGDYMARPAAGSADPGYWIQPDVLATITDPNASEDEPVTFGMLVDSREIHRGSFRYLIGADKLPIELTALSEAETGSWSDMLANQWVLVKDGDPGDIVEPGLSVLARVQAGDPLFERLYAPIKQYSLPDGDTVTLYRRAEGSPRPTDFPVVLIETRAIAEAINALWSEHATLFLSNADTATWVGIHDLVADDIRVPREGESIADLLGDEVTGTIMTVTRYDTSEVQNWLRSNSDYVSEVGDGEFRLTIFGRPERPLTVLPVGSGWEEVMIKELHSFDRVTPGEVLPIELELGGLTDGSRKLSMRLLSPTGDAVAQRDVIAEEDVRLALLVPPSTSPGPYTLAAVLYDGSTGQTFADLNDEELGQLTTVTIED